ncbi:MAG: hypothetical protein IT381_20465 [Deltaproteobacteria bacterium]|nr:hypothetical protein [Deltaproteobacteria bacterium]
MKRYLVLCLLAACGYTNDPTVARVYTPYQPQTSTPVSPTPNNWEMPAGSKLVFVTKSTYAGDDVATHEDADGKCADAAEGAGLGRNFKAWLSEPSAPANEHITDVGPWYPAGCPKQHCAKEGFNFMNLASLRTTPASYSFQDQHGSFASNDVWTASKSDGSAGESCLTSKKMPPQAHYGTLSGEDWASAALGYCSGRRGLLCLQQ